MEDSAISMLSFWYQFGVAIYNRSICSDVPPKGCISSCRNETGLGKAFEGCLLLRIYTMTTGVEIWSEEHGDIQFYKYSLFKDLSEST